MPTYTHDEYLNHPQLKIIPEIIWNEGWIFPDNVVLDYEFGLLDGSLEPRQALLTYGSLIDKLDKRNIGALRFWLCILFAHPNKPNRTAAELLEMGRELNLPLEILFKAAVLTRQQEMLDIIEINFPQLSWVFTKEDEQLFQFASKLGDLNSLKKLYSIASEQQKTILIQAGNYENHGPFYVASYEEHGRYYAFYLAACYGHPEVLEWFKERASPSQWSEMMTVPSYFLPLVGAASHGQLNVVKWFKKEVATQRQWQSMLRFKNDEVVRGAALHNHLDILKWFKAEEPLSWQSLTTIDEHVYVAAVYPALSAAISNDHIDIANWIKQEEPAVLDIFNKSYRGYPDAFYRAVNNGQLDALQWIQQEAPEQLGFFSCSDNNPFIISARNGHVKVLKWLIQEYPREWLQMLQASEKEFFNTAIQGGALDVLQCIHGQVTPAQWQFMLERNHYQSFRHVTGIYPDTKKNLEIALYFLTFPSCFAYADVYQQWYLEECIKPFVTNKLADLHTRKHQTALDNPDNVFDLNDAEEIGLCFFIIRNLIRRNDSTLFDDIQFLLDIPVLHALAHQDIEINESLHDDDTSYASSDDDSDNSPDSNELIRLALTLGNHGAAAILLKIPAVKELAQQNNYYLQEVPLADLPQALPSIVPLTNSLDLSQNRRGNGIIRRLDEWLSIFNVIPPHIIKIDLQKIDFDDLRLPDGVNIANIENFIQGLPRLRHVETVYFSHSEIEKMSPLQRKVLICLFPGIKCPVFIDDEGYALGVTLKEGKKVSGGLMTSINYANKIGFNISMPSLQAQAAFFANRSNLKMSDYPEHIQSIVKNA